ncbi:MAG: hypothetical protein VX663_01485 [Pseudomonadota bacterium]|nr:hypothetical protein [Pseudomonadota bacterium]
MIAYRATPDFNVDLRDVLSRAEGFKNFVYHDSSGVPTLGYGVALILQNAAGQWVVRSNLDPLLASIEIVLSSTQREALEDAAQFLQNGNTAAAKALFPPPDADIVANPDLNTMGFTITEPEGNVLFTAATKEAIGNLWTALGGSLFDTVALNTGTPYANRAAAEAAFETGAIAGSAELIALASLAYNSPATIGPDLQAALTNGQRERAWFEIRYRTNGSSDPNERNGTAKRRFDEAHLFSLYDDVNNVGAVEAQRVIDFLFAAPTYANAKGPTNVAHMLAYSLG